MARVGAFEVVDLTADADDEPVPAANDDWEAAFYLQHFWPPPDDYQSPGLINHAISPATLASRSSTPAFDTDTASPAHDVNLPQMSPPPLLPSATAMLSEAACVQRVSELLPDISEDHVRELYQLHPPGVNDAEHYLDRLLFRILDAGTYPKRAGVKRKRDEPQREEWEEFEKADREAPHWTYTKAA